MNLIKLSLLAGAFALSSLSANASSLLDIYELALEHDAQLAADEAAFRAGREQRTLARSALLPQLGAGAEFSRIDTRLTDNIDPNRSAPLERDQLSWSVSLRQSLFDMSRWYSYQAGIRRSEQAEARFAADQQALIVRVAEAYFNVLRAREFLEAANAEEKALEQQLEQTRQRFEVGLTAITEVHEARAAYDSATALALEARGNLAITYEALEVLTGRPHHRIAPLSERFPVLMPEPADRHEWVQFALENNYQLKAASLSAEAARQTANAASSDRLPSLSGSISYTRTEDEGTQYFGTPIESDTLNRGTRMALNLEVPLYSGGGASSRTRQARAQQDQAREEFNNFQRSVIQSTRSLHLSVETGVARVRARQQAIVSSESALEATQSGYEVGTRNLVEVLLAQRAVFQARRDYANALYDYVIDTIRLREVAGMLSPVDVQQIDQWLEKP